MESKDRDPLSPLGAGVFAALRRERLGAGLAAHLTDQGYRAVHDPATGTVRATDPLGHTTRYEPDHQGFVGAIESPLGRRWQLDNDPKGRLTGLTDPAGIRLAIDYDERGRPATLARQGGPNFRLAYDGADNLTEAHWPDGTRETFDYRDYRLLAACTDRAGARQGYDYDAAGRLHAATDANGGVTRFLYGPWDRPDATLYPDGRWEDYTWQPSPTDPGQAQLAALGDAAGSYARLRYADGRLVAIAWRDGEQVSFRHDAAGHVLEAGVGDRLVRFTYDAAGRVLTEATDGVRILYRYDPAGNLIGIKGPTGAMGYAWNADLELAAIRAWDGSTAELNYSPDGRTCETRLSERLTSRTVRTGGGRLGEVEVLAAGQRLYGARYAYDGEDRLAGVAQTDAPTLRYGYDAAGRLANVTRADGTTASYAYDPAGYRLRADQTQASYDAAGKVLVSGSERLVYDDRGRVIERTAGGLRWQYRWSDRGLLVAARSSAGVTVDYDYDAFARRTGKRVTDAQGQVIQTHFLWAGEQLIAELRQGPTGISRRDYLWYPGSHSLFALRIDGAIYYAHNDHLGATRRLTDPWGGTVWAAEIDPWGTAQLSLGHVEQPWRLPGQYHDPETGLHYNRFRYYVPSLGRYLSPDPLGLLAGFDPYAYAGNDPINAADPLGLWTWAGVAKVAVSVVAAVAVGAAVLALAPAITPLALIAAGAAAVAVGLGMNALLNQDLFSLPCIAKAAAPWPLAKALPYVSLSTSIAAAAAELFADKVTDWRAKPSAGPKISTFPTQSEAAKAALTEANPTSIKENTEYGGLIYRDASGRYGYTAPSAGSGTGFNPAAVPLPDGTTRVGDYHTHGDYSTADAFGHPVRTADPSLDGFNSDQFSGTDLRGIASDAAGNPDYRGYLGTPSGTFLQYDPSDKSPRAVSRLGP